MSDLTIQLEEVEGASDLAIVALKGSIDAKTIFVFQNRLTQLTEKGYRRFAIDMEQVKYVNSTGLGYLINLADTLTTEGGEVALVRVQPKVKVVFDMLGLNAFFRVFRSRDEALSYFRSSAAAAPEAETVYVPKGGTRPRPEPASPPTVLISPPSTPPPKTEKLKDPRAESPPPAPPREEKPAAAEASTGEGVPCEGCSVPLILKEPGLYKCPRCFTLIEVRPGGVRVAIRRRKANPMQISLELAPEMIQGFLGLVGRMAQGVGFDEPGADRLCQTVQSLFGVIREHVYAGNERSVVHALLSGADSEFELRFATAGQGLPDNGALLAPVRSSVDRFELVHPPRGGNVLTLIKKAK